MAFAAAARRSLASRGLSDLLARRSHPSLTHLLPSDSTREPRKPSSPLPPPPAPRSFHFAPTPCGTSQTLTFPPFGLRLLPGPPYRSFSSSSSSRDPDFTDALTDAAAAPASFPGEVAWAAEDSSTAVAAVQHLIDAVHDFTGLNWWISIALSTVLLRCMVSTVSMLGKKRAYVMRHDVQDIRKLMKNAKDDESTEKLMDAFLPFMKKSGLVVFLPPIVTPFIFINLYIAISNMVEKVPSLKVGGAFWFTDLTTPDALCIFPMITSLFIMLPLELYSSVKCEGCSRKMEKIRWAWRAISLLPMLWTATLPQAISCSFVTWTSLSLAEKIALRQPAVQKVLFGTPFEQRRCSSCDAQKGPTAKNSPPPVKEEEQPVPPETSKSSDTSVHNDESDKNSTKGE